MSSPEFCPDLHCPLHSIRLSEWQWYHRVGTYRTSTFGRVQRFRCRFCGKWFSTQTFSLDYFAKRLVDYRLMLIMLVSCVGTRALSRALSVSPATIANRVFRLARQAIAVHSAVSKRLRLSEDLVADGFESFVVSQYFPNNINLLAGAESQYVYGLNYAPLRRNGRMTEDQKIRREELEKLFLAPPDAVRKTFSELCEQILKLYDNTDRRPLVLSTDEHRSYRGAMRGNSRMTQLLREGKIIHRKVNSHHARVPGGPLFSADYLDREIRKDMSDHVRETVRFARNVNNSMGRIVLYLVHHNCAKVYRIRAEGHDKRTHAEVAGADSEMVKREMESLFGPRRFVSREGISGGLKRIWLRLLETPLRGTPEYVPAYAHM